MDQYSYISNADPIVIESYYQQYLSDPLSVDQSWQKFFEGFNFAHYSQNGNASSGSGNISSEKQLKEAYVVHLIHGYRNRGHLLSTTNPIRQRKDRQPGLQLENFHLSESDLEDTFQAGQLIKLPGAKLKDIIAKLKSTYCQNIGFEYMHIRNTEMREYCRDWYEATANKIDFPLQKKKRILSKLNEAVVFENFLHKKYVGQKRFSLEGGENTIPALDAIINKGSELGVEFVSIGMAHRGRLNVLANILGKTYEYIFNEFEGNTMPDVSFGDGDVKYHMGFHSQVETTAEKKAHLYLSPNPSHLEAVDPVMLGHIRAVTDLSYQKDYNKILPVIIHGDAALAGQGIVYEVAQMSQLPGYHVGGAIHFVINNQIGFTTDFFDARSSDYCTAVGKVVDAPIIHVNGDDAESIVYAVEFAVEFRQKYKTDVYIDMLCYRRHGHNESDEPKFTQPTLYALIDKHPNPREVYKQKLIERGDIIADVATQMEEEFQALLQDRLNMVKQKPLPFKPQALERAWDKLRKSTPEDFDKSPNTAVSKESLDLIIKALTTIPDSVKPIKKVEKLLQERANLFEQGKINWALGEMLAYGSILLDQKKVRISGQDVIRGTFSHRHAFVLDETTNQAYNSLMHISENQGRFSIYNSLLSEYAVLGFEYGYSLASPDVLNIWEAQFGDFANGAQTLIDQFISSGESKWQKMSGLILLLPHGYEGQGPEHSNARPERFLQLAAEYNMIVANCTLPGNYFHLLRRQMAWDFRKPLIVMSPKQLLRHPVCISSIDELTTGGFRELIDDDSVKPKDVKKVLMCSGKIYYDLLERKLADKRDDVAIVRIEQLYPMPEKQIDEIYKKYAEATFYWVQEEPKNMGYWTYMLRYEENMRLKLIARKASASPATGFMRIHKIEQEEIINKSFE